MKDAPLPICVGKTTTSHTLSEYRHYKTNSFIKFMFDISTLGGLSSNCHIGVIKASQEAARGNG